MDWNQLATFKYLGPGLRILFLLAVGLPLLHILTSLLSKALKKYFSEQSVMVVRKAVFYVGLILIVFSVVREMGFNLTAILGTAGVVGIAVGFASQTSLSNIISGVFLIWERPFQLGDLIRIGDRTGVVVAIDLLSVKVRTMDNQFVRIPNENLIKQELVNLTRYPIRRMDISLGVAYKEDVEHVRRVLKEIARDNPYCLDEPEPLILFTEFGSSALEFKYGLWFVKTDFVALRNSIMETIKKRFDGEGIEIPFPHRTLYTGSATEPFPVRVVEVPLQADNDH